MDVNYNYSHDSQYCACVYLIIIRIYLQVSYCIYTRPAQARANCAAAAAVKLNKNYSILILKQVHSSETCQRLYVIIYYPQILILSSGLYVSKWFIHGSDSANYEYFLDSTSPLTTAITSRSNILMSRQ